MLHRPATVHRLYSIAGRPRQDDRLLLWLSKGRLDDGENDEWFGFKRKVVRFKRGVCQASLTSLKSAILLNELS